MREGGENSRKDGGGTLPPGKGKEPSTSFLLLIQLIIPSSSHLLPHWPTSEKTQSGFLSKRITLVSYNQRSIFTGYAPHWWLNCRECVLLQKHNAFLSSRYGQPCAISGSQEGVSPNKEGTRSSLPRPSCIYSSFGSPNGSEDIGLCTCSPLYFLCHSKTSSSNSRILSFSRTISV